MVRGRPECAARGSFDFHETASMKAMCPADRPLRPGLLTAALGAIGLATLAIVAFPGSGFAQVAPSPAPANRDAAPPPPPAAAELCVVCEEPPALYRCRTEGADPNAPPAQGSQIKCVTEIAQRGGHGRCRIDKTKPALACDGRFISVSAPPQPLPGSEPAKAPASPVAPAPASKPPQTVEALVKEAAQQSKEANDQATSAIGRAAKKTWDCVSSFFTRC